MIGTCQAGAVASFQMRTCSTVVLGDGFTTSCGDRQRGALYGWGCLGNPGVQARHSDASKVGGFKTQSGTQTIYLLLFLRKFVDAEFDPSKEINPETERRGLQDAGDPTQTPGDRNCWEDGGEIGKPSKTVGQPGHWPGWRTLGEVTTGETIQLD